VTRRRLGVIGVVVTVVAVVVLRYFVWLDLGGGCVIGLRPSLVGYDNTTIKRALATLHRGSPEDYRKVCAHVAWINEGRRPRFDLEHECYGEDDRILRALVQFE